jgi:putative SOS response-associated peptidase YedK
MCGKFTQMMSWGEVVEYSDFLKAPKDGPAETATPTRFASIIRMNPETGKRESVRMRWGIPKPGRDDPLGPGYMHVRSETIDTLKTWRDPFLYRRGIVVVHTFNEGKELPNGKTEQHIVTPNDAKPIAIAVLWERWADRNSGALLCFAIVTTPPNKLIGTITDRMPAIIQPESWAKWLGEEPAHEVELKSLLVPFEGDWTMKAAEKNKPPTPKKPAKNSDAPREPDLF